MKMSVSNELIPTSDISTFKDLFEFLQIHDEINITSWLAKPWKGKDKQESLLRLFSGLGLLYKLNKFQFCKGNFNLQTICEMTSMCDVFYDEHNRPIYLKDKGDASDLTGISKTNKKHLLLTTSKNINKTQVGKLGIDQILTHFQQYKAKGFTMSLCVCIRSVAVFQTMKTGIEKTNKELKLLLDKEDTLIIDWNDLNEAYNQFKLHFGNTHIDAIIHSTKRIVCLKMHQYLGVLKTLRMKSSDMKIILWGHIQRSGKSYIIAGCIIQDSQDKEECNYLVITTAPSETLEQQMAVFDCVQLEDFEIILLNGKNKKPKLSKKNIIICSKQFLQTKIESVKENCVEPTKSIAWLKRMNFDMRFIDESHNGGTTELTKKTLEFYGKESFTVQITATYLKPINDYKIPRDCWILWDLEDIKLCKNITNEGNVERLIQKHGAELENIVTKYSTENIITEYSKYPELCLLTDEITPHIVKEIIRNTRENEYGWSTDACFLLKQGVKTDKITFEKKVTVEAEFQKEAENLKLWFRIFGKTDTFGIPDKDYPDVKIFMKRIEKICKNPSINSRFMGEGNYCYEPMVVMAFLPQKNIYEISKATINLLEKHSVIPDYEIISINSKTNDNPKKSIEDARMKARNTGKKGILVLSGKQCSLGVSIDNCDIVLLLNNNMGFDMIYQMMFRCMTEGAEKKCGFVVDLNINRAIETSVITYASLLKPDIHPREATKYILQERLINLNSDHWMPTFGNDVSKLTSLCENVYDIYSSSTENALNHFLNRLRFKIVLLTKEEQKIFNVMFNKTTPTKQQKELIDKFIEELENEDDVDADKVKKGIEKTQAVYIDNDSDTSSVASDKEEEEKHINFMDILKHIIPLICILTIHNEETSFVEMFDVIKNDKYIYEILIDQTKSWWGKSINSSIIRKFINIYIKYMKDDKETNQIIRTVKELFIKNMNNNKELSKLIDKYLVPQELEKKSNAEVSTPFKLRQEMLDKLPTNFWNTPKKVFEPCSGKGGFIVDIIDRFMIGLKDHIADEKLRYKTIVEGCLYFSDINSTNIFICKLLIDPYNEYKLNYNEGNTLEIDMRQKWSISGVDAVIGNPPYQNSNGASNGTLWDKFVLQSLDITKTDGYICLVHPSGWRNVNGKFKKLQKDMFGKNMLYLEIHNESDGIDTFKAETRYDWYVIQNNDKYTTTKIKFEDRKIMDINIRELEFIPNGQYDLVKKLLANEDDEKCEVLYSRSSYGCDKQWVSKTKIDEFEHPCVYTINSKSQLKLFYSNKNNGNGMNKKKLMWSNGRIKSIGSVIDKEGKYGLTQFAYGIVDKEENLENIKKAFDSHNFRRLMEYCAVCQLTVNYKIIALFKKDFWKEFI